MKEKIKNAIEKYQCPGCVCGHDISCFEKNSEGVGCGKHLAGTIVFPVVGKMFLGMPKGFNRVGGYEKLKLVIFETLDGSWGYDVFNVPVWKHLSKAGHTMVRGLTPRLNQPFLHIYLENCLDKIDCLEISKEDIDKMD